MLLCRQKMDSHVARADSWTCSDVLCWVAPAPDGFASTEQQSKISFLSHHNLFAVTVSAAPWGSLKPLWLGAGWQGFIPAFTDTNSALGRRNTSGLKHYQTISSEGGRVAVQEHTCCGATHSGHQHSHRLSPCWGTHQPLGDTFCPAMTDSLTPRRTLFDFWSVIHPQSFKFQKSWMYTWRYWTQKLWKCIKFLLHNKDHHNLAAGTKILTVKAETWFWI